MPRRPFDMYETPPHYLQALEILGLPIAPTDRILEPCVGESAIASWLVNSCGVKKVYTNDVDPKRVAWKHEDATTYDFHKSKPYPWVVTNPPFSKAFEILSNIWNDETNIVMLTRISFHEPTQKRGDWLASMPPKFVLFLPRYSFRANDQGKRQTDSVTCCWTGWGPDVPEGIFYSTVQEDDV